MDDKLPLSASPVTRRTALGLAGLAGVLVSVDGISNIFTPSVAQAATSASCTLLTSAGEEGPYWVDTELNRSDVRSNSDGTGTITGVPLTLTFVIQGDDCVPIEGAQVDIWQASPAGLYSDEQSESTLSDNWLRGYQKSDASGKLTFLTVWPGWYSGRAVHIHARVRLFNGSSTTLNFLTQMFFDDTVTDTVYATSPYNERGARDTRNVNDRVYQAEGSENGVLMLPATGNTTSGYTGAVTITVSAAGNSSGTTTTKNSAPILGQKNGGGKVVLTVKTSSDYSGKTVYFYRRSGQTGKVVPLGTATVNSGGYAFRTFKAKEGQILDVYAKVQGATNIATPYSNTIAFKVT